MRLSDKQIIFPQYYRASILVPLKKLKPVALRLWSYLTITANLEVRIADSEWGPLGFRFSTSLIKDKTLF